MKNLDAIELWSAIIDYADSQGILEGEGNSGEFHDDKEFARIEKHHKQVTETLINSFASNTGWKPVFIEGTDKNRYQDTWELVKQ